MDEGPGERIKEIIHRICIPILLAALGGERVAYSSCGFVDILELGGTTAYPKAVICEEESLPAAEVYSGLYALGN